MTQAKYIPTGFVSSQLLVNRAWETAAIIQRDLGLLQGVRYARRIAANNGPLSNEYECAAFILEMRAKESA